jgi:hypothetical protein
MCSPVYPREMRGDQPTSRCERVDQAEEAPSRSASVITHLAVTQHSFLTRANSVDLAALANEHGERVASASADDLLPLQLAANALEGANVLLVGLSALF